MSVEIKWKDQTIFTEGGGSITVDTALDSTSTNPVQNKVIKSALLNKQNTLVSGTNIKTINNESILGSGNVRVQPTLVSGTNIKTINNESILGSGNIDISGGGGGGISIASMDFSDCFVSFIANYNIGFGFQSDLPNGSIIAIKVNEIGSGVVLPVSHFLNASSEVYLFGCGEQTDEGLKDILDTSLEYTGTLYYIPN